MALVTRWRDVKYAVVDLETTGTDQRVHEVLSIGILPIDDGRIAVGQEYYQTVRPTLPPGRASIVLHGIRPVDAAAGHAASDLVEDVEMRLRGRVLVSHVAEMERGFLNRWLTYRYLRPRDLVDTDVLSRLIIARQGGPLLTGHIGLGAAAGHFGLPEHRRHHALGDALTTAQLFLATASLLRPDDSATLADLRRAPRLLKREQGRQRIWRAMSRGREAKSYEIS